MKLPAILSIVVISSLGQTIGARFYFAAGDQETARLNGVSVGVELSESNLKVANSARFKVQLWMELSNIMSVTPVSGFQTNIAFDRSFRGEAENWDYLDEHAFRKLAPVHIDRNENFSNFQEFDSYWFDGVTPRDDDNDGVQDRAMWRTLNTASLYGTSGDGLSVRPVGLGVTIDSDNLSSDLPGCAQMTNGRYRLWDYEFINFMAPGETYGYGEGETGLWIFTHPVPRGNSNTRFSSFESVTFSGGRYNILAVPEPSSSLALGLGLVYLRRRKR
jgi:hypothetical protein